MKNLTDTMVFSKNRIWLFCLVLFASMGSCTNLDEQVYSEVTEDSFTPSDSDIAALMASAYTPMRFVMDWYGYFDLQEEPGDMIVTPTRPNGWDDGGTYKRMHFHTWDNLQGQPVTTWQNCFNGINSVNRVILQVKSGTLPVDEDQMSAIVAEMRALRALYYSMLIDTHGNVPIIKDYSDEIPTQNSRQEVYDFIASELNEVIPQLSEEVGTATYGRMTKWAAYHILARIYLNAKVYTGTAQWDKCIEVCNEIINSGKFALSDTYKSIFSADNEGNLEMVFAIPYDEIYALGFSAEMKWLLPDHRKVFDMEAQPWGDSSCNPQFIESYDPADNRLEDTWRMGDQLNAKDGSVVVTLYKKMPSIYNCAANDGFRCGKYEVQQGAKSSLNNDFPFLRYTDVLMMKAESLLQTGKGDDAAQIVTQVRMRDFDDPEDAKVSGAELEGNTTIKYGTLAEDGSIADPGDQTPVKYGRFLDELGWEFACEARRRCDMIRFGVYQTKSWYNHKPQGEYTTLFPIGLQELNTNSNLKQNPGY